MYVLRIRTHICAYARHYSELKAAALDEQCAVMYTGKNQGKRLKHEKFHEVDIWWIIEVQTVDVEMRSSSFKLINAIVWVCVCVWALCLHIISITFSKHIQTNKRRTVKHHRERSWERESIRFNECTQRVRFYVPLK